MLVEREVELSGRLVLEFVILARLLCLALLRELLSHSGAAELVSQLLVDGILHFAVEARLMGAFVLAALLGVVHQQGRSPADVLVQPLVFVQLFDAGTVLPEPLDLVERRLSGPGQASQFAV